MTESMKIPKYPRLPILIVDDQENAVRGCEYTLRTAGINHTLPCMDGRQVTRVMRECEVGVVLLDLYMPHIAGEELLHRLAREHPEVPVIVITGANQIETAVSCMKAGAFDYMLKPVEENRMISGVKRAIEMRELRREYDAFKQRVLANELERPEAFAPIVTQSPTMRSIFQYLETISKTDRPVLITGETGVGKELVARAIHELSECPGRFVAVNIAGLDDTMFSDTLFGHQKGAFTGAGDERRGLIEHAAEGTLFLDEIGDMNAASQIKLLRLLQEHEYFPLGADAPKRIDARVVVATNKTLPELRGNNEFRTDLYYRLQTHHVHVPPLRERKEDIPLLADHFLERASQAQGKSRPTCPPELYDLLASYHFPGNIRELESMVFDAVSRHHSKVLSMNTFREHIRDRRKDTPPAVVHPRGESPYSHLVHLPTLKEASGLLIHEALRRAGGNQSVAAEMLGITRSGLNKAMKRHDIEAPKPL